MAIAWASLWAAAILLLPGWVIWRLVGPRSMPRALEVAPAFALSLALVALLGWSGYALGLGFTAVKVELIVVLVLAVLGSPVALRYRPPVATESVSPPWTLWGAAVIAVGAGLWALYSGPWLSSTADTFYHLAAIRSVIEHGTALPKEVFFSEQVPAADPTSGAWHLALALISSLSGEDAVTVWRVATVAVAPLTVFGFFALALSITRSGLAALIACALYVVLALSFDFRGAAYPNRFGLLLAWLALAFALRFADNGSRRELAVAAPIAFAASAVHPALSPFLIVTLACGVAGAVVFRSPSWKRLAVAAAVVGAAALPLLIVDLSSFATATPYAAMAVTSPMPLRTVHHPWTWVWPGFWYDNPGTVLGTAFAVSVLRFWRAGEVGAGLLIAAMLAIPAAAITPLFATTYSGQYLLARVAGVLEPLAWVLWGWGIAVAIGALRGRLRLAAAGMIVISAVAAAFAFKSGPAAPFRLPAGSLQSYATTRSSDLTVAWADRLAAIDRLPRSAVLLAEPRMAYELAGLTDKDVVAVPLSHTPAQIEARDGPRRRADAADAVQGRLDPASLAGVIENYGVTDLIVDMDRTGPAAWEQLASAPILIPIASGDRWRLYRYDPSMLDGYLDLHTQVGPDPGLAVGIGPQMALAGRAVFARLQGSPGSTGSARLTAEALDSTTAFSRVVEIGAASSQTFALPIPPDTPAGQYRLTIVPSAAQPIALGQFDVGRLYQAEDMGGVVAGDSSGWTIVGGQDYLGTLAAAATNPGSATHQAILPVGAGTYCIAARVYDDGTNRTNVVQVTVGDGAAQLSWSGSAPGMSWATAQITLSRASGQVSMKLVQRGQAAATIDALELYPPVAGACDSG